MVEGFGIEDFPYAFVWNKSVPPKVNFLVWCILHEKLNTIDNLHIRGVDIYNSCILCGDDTESHDHVFLHCKVAHKIWSMIFPTSCWSWVVPGNMKMLACNWQHKHFSASGNFIWSLIPAAVVYTIWLERNKRIFEPNHTFKTEADLGMEVRSSILAWADAANRSVHINHASTVLNTSDAIFI
ncbi:uncharacterized protein LOC113352288 [Papaver somniferum]|uniref:uncharacterized protein LOC113352288 n=1 Tax=Papaver somniferum TaxID=3469 RepID=UPI000E6F9013|nr:uncharacterized protein LOC113352288 [Papaver somniferum]